MPSLALGSVLWEHLPCSLSSMAVFLRQILEGLALPVSVSLGDWGMPQGLNYHRSIHCCGLAKLRISLAVNSLKNLVSRDFFLFGQSHKPINIVRELI